MKHPFIAPILAFSIVFAMPTAALAASGSSSNRYFVPTTKAFWRSALGARNVFPDGFTADLNGLQLSVARWAGLKPIAVKKFNILAEQVAPSASPTPQITPSQSVSWGVRTMLGNDKLQKTSGGAGITVAVLDTGIDSTHPDLQDRIDGCFDLTDSVKAFIDGSCDDTNGHGTHMAGIIAADGGPDGTGFYGFAPQASISAYRVCNSDGMCLSDDIAVAIRHAVDAGDQIIVLGLGGEAESSFIDDALKYAADHDVMVIAAAGNDGPYDDSVDWPARNPITISVGAVDNERVQAEFSSRGRVDFVAPGVNIESTFLDGGYAILSGTSMAAPHVAGLAALEWQKDAAHPAQATRDLLHKLASGAGIPTLPSR